MRILELDDNIIYMDDPGFTCELDDGRTVYLGLICEAIDLREIDSRYDNDPHPVAIETQVVVAPKSLNRQFLEEAKKSVFDYELENDAVKVYVAYSYAGGVPINMESITGSINSDVDSEVRIIKHSLYGEIETRRFRTIEDALAYARKVYAHNCRALFAFIGFYLDRTLNLAGTTGWEIIELQALNKDYKISRGVRDDRSS